MTNLDKDTLSIFPAGVSRAARERRRPGTGIVLAAMLAMPAFAPQPAVGQESTAPDAGQAAVSPSVPEDAGDAVSETPMVPAEPAVPADPIRDYLEAIARAEVESSPYSLQMADLYLGLGQHYREREEYEAARAALLRGMQVLRVNYGPNSPDQTSWMFSLADVESRLGNAQLADRLLNRIYSINAGVGGPEHPDMLPVLEQLFAWYQSNYEGQAPAFQYRNLSNSEIVVSQMAKILEREAGPQHADTANAYRVIGQLNYLMALQLSRDDLIEQPKFSFTMRTPVREPAMKTPVSRHFARGRDAVERYAEAVVNDPARSPLERADAVAQLGDWYLLFDKPMTAAKSYGQAFQMLQEGSGSRALADEFFGQPRPLQLLDETPGASALSAEELGAPGVEVLLSVSKSGRIRDVEWVGAPEEFSEKDRDRISKRLRGLRFRPRLVAGVPESTERFRWNYVPAQEAAAP